MRRWGALAILGAWTALALLVAVARWAGQQPAPRIFPIPGEDGCWQALCPFDHTLETVLAALAAQPGVAPGSVERVPGVTGLGDYRFQFRYAAAGGPPQTIELVWDPLIFLFTPVDPAPGGPWPLLGDVVAVLGVPERVMLLSNQVSLHYAQHTVVTSSVRGAGPPYRLSPDDHVSGISVMRRDPAPFGARVYYLPSSSWRGFTFYEFD